MDKLDEHLTRLINTYTLSGTPILVHCRGGVGRAGLVACCWALKLGLCGWIDTEPASRGAPGYMAEMTTAAAPMPLASPSSSDEVGALQENSKSPPSSVSVDRDADTNECRRDEARSEEQKKMVSSDEGAEGGEDVRQRTGVRRDTLQLVERAITLVRRRRSPKAVETFEQVKFLVDYIEFLRTKARSDKAESQGLGLEIQEFLVGSVLGNDIRKAQ